MLLACESVTNKGAVSTFHLVLILQQRRWSHCGLWRWSMPQQHHALCLGRRNKPHAYLQKLLIVVSFHFEVTKLVYLREASEAVRPGLAGA